MLRHPGIALHLGRDRIQGVEQKVRIQLHPQCIQTSLGEAAFQPLHPQFTRQVTLVVLVGLPGAHNQPVDQPAPQEHAAKGHEQRLRIVGRAPRFDAKERQHRGEHVNVGCGDRQAEEEMQEDPPGELLV
jgi:hypothetical protein